MKNIAKHIAAEHAPELLAAYSAGFSRTQIRQWMFGAAFKGDDLITNARGMIDENTVASFAESDEQLIPLYVTQHSVDLAKEGTSGAALLCTPDAAAALWALWNRDDEDDDL